MKMVTCNELQIDDRLWQFVNQQVLPLVNIEQQHFWRSFQQIVEDFQPRNLALLEHREQLQQTLKAAGAPTRAINMVPEVVNACQVCRMWKRSGNKSTLSGSLSTSFNLDVQFDLLFFESALEPQKGRRPIIHLIDTCLRWSATQDCGR